VKRLACKRFEFSNQHGRGGACTLDIFDHSNKIVVLVIDINEGVSVTNAAELIQTRFFLSTEMHNAFPHLDKDNVVFIEHYPNHPPAHWDRCYCEWDEGKQEFVNPTWVPVAMWELKELTGNVYP
jgi:hypothetical protein